MRRSTFLRGRPVADDDGRDRAARLRDAAARTRTTPARVEWLFANQEAVNESLRHLIGQLDEANARLAQLEPTGGLDARLYGLADEGRGGVEALADEIHRLRRDLDLQLAELDAALASQAGILHRAIATPERDRELARIIAGLGPARPLRPALSIFTICWNHGGLLAASVRSGLAALDRLPSEAQGQLLVLDDASSDETAAVAADLARLDPRVRVVTAATNLGLARARNALLHSVDTSHALQLDADNTATAAGVEALYDVARRYRAAFTYGNVLRQDADGATVGVMSNEPLVEPWFRSNYIDTMGIVDTAMVRSLGGWPTDPLLEHVEDWALVHRIARAGGLVGFVPVVVGRYRSSAAAFHLTVPDRRIGPGRVARTFNADGRLLPDAVAAFAAHPVVGPLWATGPARAAHPDLAALTDGPAPEAGVAQNGAPRLLLVGSGGVSNLGDDAIVTAALARLRALAPGYEIDVLTDGPDPVGLGLDATWLGTLSEAVWGLVADDLPLDEAVARAWRRVPSTSWPLRTVEPGSYAGAVFAGGGSLTSLWGDTLVAPRAVLAAALAHAGVPYVMSGQGLGPLDAADADLVSTMVGRAARVGVRDDASAALSGGPPVEVTGDDALLLPSAGPATVAEALLGAGVDGPYLVVTARDATYVGATVDGLEAWAAAVDAEAARRGITVLGIALNQQEASPEIATLARLAHGGRRRAAPWRLVSCVGDAELLAGLVAGADAVAAQSFHAALFGLRAGVPTVLGVSSEYYRAKARGLGARSGLGSAIVVDLDQPLDLAGPLAAVAAALPAATGLARARERVERWWSDAVGSLLPSPLLTTTDAD